MIPTALPRADSILSFCFGIRLGAKYLERMHSQTMHQALRLSSIERPFPFRAVGAIVLRLGDRAGCAVCDDVKIFKGRGLLL